MFFNNSKVAAVILAFPTERWGKGSITCSAAFEKSSIREVLLTERSIFKVHGYKFRVNSTDLVCTDIVHEPPTLPLYLIAYKVAPSQKKIIK